MLSPQVASAFIATVITLQCRVTSQAISGDSLATRLLEQTSDQTWGVVRVALSTDDPEDLDYLAETAGHLVGSAQDILACLLQYQHDPPN